MSGAAQLDPDETVLLEDCRLTTTVFLEEIRSFFVTFSTPDAFVGRRDMVSYIWRQINNPTSERLQIVDVNKATVQNSFINTKRLAD